MDAPTSSAHELACDLCGYSRIGLPADALCPECGEPPPQISEQAKSTQTPFMSIERSAYLQLIALGLILLITSSLTALGVALVMPVGPLEVAAVNVPAPKIYAVALVERTIGGPPGPWGVAGTTAVLTTVVALWLVTIPRSLRGDEEPPWSIRLLARWVGILATGAVLGWLLSAREPYVAPRGAMAGRWIAFILLFCELPANSLLYLHLRQLAADLGDRRAASFLAHSVWLIPLFIAGAGAIALYSTMGQAGLPDAQWPLSARFAMMAYAAMAVAAGAAATAGVFRLLLTTLGLCLANWRNSANLSLARLPRFLRRAFLLIQRQPSHWAVLSGILLWLWASSQIVTFSVNDPTQNALYGDLPMLDLPAPKVAVAPLSVGISDRYASRLSHITLVHSAILILAAVWLMTWPQPQQSASRRALATFARWLALLSSGLALGSGILALRMDFRNGWPFNHSRILAFAVGAAEAATTLLVYLHLAALARSLRQRRLKTTLTVLGVVVAALAMIPLGAFLSSTPARVYPRVPLPKWVGLVCAAQVSIAFVVTFLCVTALGRLAWAVASTAAATSGNSAATSGNSQETQVDDACEFGNFEHAPHPNHNA